MAAPPADVPDRSVVTVFRSRLRPGVEGEYRPLAEHLEALARRQPGFVDFKTFVAADGERVSLVTFADRASHDAWRAHPEHRAAQELGRRRFYESYDIAVCRPLARRRAGPSAPG